MITLMVNVYAEDPAPAIASARASGLPIDREVIMHGRYEGFPDLGGEGPVWPSEHAKRNEMLRLAGEPDPRRWLFWLDCDERVIYASPIVGLQLQRLEWPYRPIREDVAGVRFIEPLHPDAPGLEDPRRRVFDHVVDPFPRLIRHLPGLEYRHRHDYLVGDGRLLVGWEQELPAIPAPVDMIVVHLRVQPPRRVEAKRAYYEGPIRRAESQPHP